MASFTVPCPKCSYVAHLGLKSQGNQHKLSFESGLSLNRFKSFGSKFGGSESSGPRCLNRKQFSLWKLQAQHKEVSTVQNSSNSAPFLINEPKVASSKEKEDNNGKLSGPSISADASSISAFMAQVSELVKLVDSRDIVELQLKQLDCELMIRKKEALQPPPAAVIAPMSPPLPYSAHPMPPQPLPAAASAPAASPSKLPPSLPSPGKASTSSRPLLKCPMAGTFYRSPAPGEPPFVKVGDKVQKGQVICIIEAMKLMNEIEADQSGTIAEILVEDAKPVSVDTPLFVIVP